MEPDLSDALRLQLDRQAVKDITIAYCWALDRHEFEGLRSVFLPDATARLGDEECDGGRDSGHGAEHCRLPLGRSIATTAGLRPE